jgi:NAD(P)-dependent dehydrogenase (short-subunit alcohol dehydrogenase family)
VGFSSQFLEIAMQGFEGKTLVLIGATNPLGELLARTFGQQGMRVALADRDGPALESVRRSLCGEGIDVQAFPVEAASRASVDALAEGVLGAYGKVHILCSNPQLSGHYPSEFSGEDWRLLIDHNVMSIIYAAEAFLPTVMRHGEGGHFVNTASLAGLLPTRGAVGFCAAHSAVVGLSETWRAELAPYGIGVTVLSPGSIPSHLTQLHAEAAVEDDSDPDRYSDPGVPLSEFATCLIEAVQNNLAYAFFDPKYEALVRRRFDDILRAFDRAASSKVLSRGAPAPGGGALAEGSSA